MRTGKRSSVEFIRTGAVKRTGVYLPANLAAASEDGGEFVKAKMTRKVVSWVLAFGDVRVVMEENRSDGTVRKIVVRVEGETVLRHGAMPIQAGAVRDAVAEMEGFDTQPAIEVFNKVAQKVVGTADGEFVRAGNKNDQVATKGGDDTYYAAKGDDGVNLGGGDDTAVYAELNRGIRADLRKGVVNKGGGDKDDLKGVENVVGTGKKDVIKGDGEANRLEGLNGNDRIKGRGGDDSIDGGAGRDRLDGGSGADFVFGGIGNDIIRGGSGDDSLFGGDGVDVLTGGPGTDAMTGGIGADVFVLDATPSDQGPDTVTDFSEGQGDKLALTGEASEYSAEVVNGSTEISRDGEVVAVLVGVEAPDVVADSIFN